MVSAVHPNAYPEGANQQLFKASKGLHMVSAVHLELSTSLPKDCCASKGLHMVSAVHPAMGLGGDSQCHRFKGAAHG